MIVKAQNYHLRQYLWRISETIYSFNAETLDKTCKHFFNHTLACL